MNGAGRQVWQFDPLRPVNPSGPASFRLGRHRDHDHLPFAACGAQPTPALHPQPAPRHLWHSATCSILTHIRGQTAWHLQRCAMRLGKGRAPESLASNR